MQSCNCVPRNSPGLVLHLRNLSFCNLYFFPLNEKRAQIRSRKKRGQQTCLFVVPTSKMPMQIAWIASFIFNFYIFSGGIIVLFFLMVQTKVLLISRDTMHVDIFFLSFLSILVVPYKLLLIIVLLHDHSYVFFLMVVKLPKLYSTGLFCRALAPFKMPLALPVKSIFLELKLFKKIFDKTTF